MKTEIAAQAARPRRRFRFPAAPGAGSGAYMGLGGGVGSPQARSSEVAARGAWAKARNQYERVLGLTLRNHNVSVEEAVRGQVSRPSTPAIPKN